MTVVAVVLSEHISVFFGKHVEDRVLAYRKQKEAQHFRHVRNFAFLDHALIPLIQAKASSLFLRNAFMEESASQFEVVLKHHLQLTFSHHSALSLELTLIFWDQLRNCLIKCFKCFDSLLLRFSYYFIHQILEVT